MFSKENYRSFGNQRLTHIIFDINVLNSANMHLIVHNMHRAFKSSYPIMCFCSNFTLYLWECFKSKGLYNLFKPMEVNYIFSDYCECNLIRKKELRPQSHMTYVFSTATVLLRTLHGCQMRSSPAL